MEQELKGRGSLIVSPHSDDAGLSIGALLAARVLPSPVMLLTVFAVSGFTRLSAHGDPAVVSTWRKQEDLVFAKHVGGKPIFLKYQDALIRMSILRVSSVYEPRPLDHELVASICAQLEGLLALHSPSFLVAPLACGGHIDHLTIAHAVYKLMWVDTLYYADQPYAGINILAPKFGGVPMQLVGAAHISDWVLREKIACTQIYASQPAPSWLRELLLASNRGETVESLWRVAA